MPPNDGVETVLGAACSGPVKAVSEAGCVEFASGPGTVPCAAGPGGGATPNPGSGRWSQRTVPRHKMASTRTLPMAPRASFDRLVAASVRLVEEPLPLLDAPPESALFGGMTTVRTSSGSLPLRVGGGGGFGTPCAPGLAGEPLGNHQEGTSPLSLTPEGLPAAAGPITRKLPQTGHRVRFPAW